MARRLISESDYDRLVKAGWERHETANGSFMRDPETMDFRTITQALAIQNSRDKGETDESDES